MSKEGTAVLDYEAELFLGLELELANAEASVIAEFAAEEAERGLGGLAAAQSIEMQYVQKVTDPTFGSARAYIEAEGTPEQDAQYEYVLNDARTQLFEILTASGHVSEVEAEWDEASGSFLAYETMSLIEMYENALTVADMPEHEYKRRQAELHEELLVTSMYQNGELEDKALLVISAFPEKLDRKVAKQIGYSPDNAKYLLRWHEVDSDGNRVIQSLSMSGSDIRVLNEVYVRLGYTVDRQMDDVDMLNMPIVIELSEIASVVEIAKMIDEINGGTFYGETDGGPADYDTLIERSKQREARAKAQIESFADQWIEIERNYEGREKIKAWQAALKQTIGAIILDDPLLADSVGEEAKHHLMRARAFIESGDLESAQAMFVMGMNTMELNTGCGGLGMIGDEELFSIDAMLDPFGLHKDENEQNGVEVFKANCPHCKKENVTAVKTNCKIYCSEKGCSAYSGIDLGSSVPPSLYSSKPSIEIGDEERATFNEIMGGVFGAREFSEDRLEDSPELESVSYQDNAH